MAISLIPRSRLGALHIGSADIGNAGLPVNILNNAYSGPGGTATDGWHLTWNGQSTAWVPTPNPSSIHFADAENPSGTANSLNKIFTLANNPSAYSLQLFVGGQLMSPGNSGDYNVSGSVITFTGNGAVPGPNDTMLAYYRY
jgi:hypothetical protein